MAEVTEADREKAAALALPLRMGFAYEPVIRSIAAALAEEREKARVPFVRIADEMHEFADRRWDSTEQAVDYFKDRIRHAAEVTD